MRRLFALLATLFALTGVSASAAATLKTETAVFAGGCFWCMEHDMGGIPGVLKVESGYTGGHVKNPTYRDVTSEKSGHYESVRVTYDPAKLDYGFLLYRYWVFGHHRADGLSNLERVEEAQRTLFEEPTPASDRTPVAPGGDDPTDAAATPRDPRPTQRSPHAIHLDRSRLR